MVRRLKDPTFHMPQRVFRATCVVVLLCVDSILAFSAIITASAQRRHSASLLSESKPWRYSSPKKSKWDVRHTKSFRFELKAPKLPVDNSSAARLQSSCSCDTLPLHKKPRESLSHVLGKGLIWALYKDQYGILSTQTILVETPIPEEPHYVPDVVAFQHPTYMQSDSKDFLSWLPEGTTPTFWGESGRMSAEKAAALASKYPSTHFVHLRWGSSDQNTLADFFEDIETAILPVLHFRTAPFQFVFLANEPRSFVEEDGTVKIRKEDLQWRTAGFSIDHNY
jgi:hypothetical protein